MRFVIAAILFLFSTTGKSQPAKALLPLHFEHLSEKDGLSNNSVNSIFRDSRGFMWFGTADGLNKYDGAALNIFRHSIIDTLSIAGNNIGAVVEDKNNKLWIGAHCSGLSMLNPYNSKCDNYFADGNPGSLVTSCDLSIVFDQNKNLWISNRSALSLLNKNTKIFEHFYPFKTTENNLIYRIAIYGNKIWLSHLHGIKSFDITTKQFTGYDDLVDSSICSRIVALEDGAVMVNTWQHGLYIIDAASHKKNHLLNNITTNDAEIVNIAGDRQLWVGTSQGLYVAELDKDIFNLTDADFRQYTHNDAVPTGLSDNYINCIYFDSLKDKSVWVGSNAGIDKLNPTYLQFKTLVVTNDNNPFTVSTLYNVFSEKDKTGNASYWLGYWHGTGLLQTDSDFNIKKQIIVKDKNDKPTIVSNAIRAKDGFLWIATWDGLWCYDDKNDKLIQSYHKGGAGKIHLTANNLDYVIQDKKGRFWIGTYNQNLNMIDMHDSSVHIFNSGEGPHSLKDNRSDFLFEDSKERIWITGTALHLYNEGTNDFTVYTSKRGDSTSLPGAINRMFEDHAGKLWLATDGGLAWLDEIHHKFHNYTVKEGLPNDNCLAITEDKQYNLWVTTSGGLFSINTNTFMISSYTANDGLATNQLGQSIFRDDKGNIIFSLGQGNSPFISFDPAALLKNKSVIPFHFVSLSILGVEQSFEQSIEEIKSLKLSYKQNLFTVSFSALDYQNAAAIRYQCMLQGFDKTWINIGHRNSVTYTNLDGGTYTLKVKATNASGEWLEKELQLNITVEPPFWKTWWFYLVCICLATVIIYIVFTRRVKKIRKEEEQKTAIANEVAGLKMKALKAQMNPHFVFNSLSSIQESIVSGQTDAAAKYLGKFSKLIRLVLEFSDVKYITLRQELDYLMLYLELESFRFENFYFTVSVSDQTDKDFVKIPPMLVQPFVENAIKHGLSHKHGDKNVDIHFEETNELFIKAVISDNGIGRLRSAEINVSRTLTHQSMGMKITGDRLQLMEQKNIQLLTIEDKTDKQGKPAGTTITIFIPLETTV